MYPISTVNVPGIILEQLAVVDVATNELRPVELTKPTECEGGHILRLMQLLPNQVGLVLECYSADPHKSFEDYILVWDSTTETQTQLYKYPPRFRAYDFAISPDRSEMLQERDGDGIHNTLYRVNLQGDIEQLFTDYFRVGSPAWTLDGSRIAFAGTKQTPEDRSSIFTGLVAIDNALAQPWVIYVAKPDLSAQQVLVDDVYNLSIVRWSPDGRFLGFAASEYQDQAGVFIVDLNSNEITQVWSEFADFNWSPDGEKLVIMLAYGSGEFKQPAILNVSELMVKHN